MNGHTAAQLDPRPRSRSLSRSVPRAAGSLLLAAGTIAVAVGVFPLEAQAATMITVTNCAASGAGSLPAAVATANTDNNGDIIGFALSGQCSTITLTTTLAISGNMTIDGPGAASLAVSGGNAVGVFSVAATVSDATISGLTIENGMAAAGSSGSAGGGSGGNGSNGGGINNSGALTLTNTTLTANDAGAAGQGGAGTSVATGGSGNGGNGGTGGSGGNGGGIYNAGTATLTITDSTISGNVAGGAGANGLAAGLGGGNGGSAGTTSNGNGGEAGNSGNGGNGGGIYNLGTLSVSGSSLSSNAAGNGGRGGLGGQSASSSGRGNGGNGGKGGNGGSGGGIYNLGTLTVSGTSFSANAAGEGGFGGGGGVGDGIVPFGVGGDGGNSGLGGSGGAVYNAGSLTASNVTLAGNSAGSGGSAGVGGGTFGSIDPVTAGRGGNGGNSNKGGDGGAVYNIGTVAVTNATLSGNAAGNGGTGGDGGSTCSLNCAGNGGNGGEGGFGGDGGGIANAATLTVSSTTVSTNAAGNGGSGGSGGIAYNGGTNGIGGDGGSGGGGGGIYNDGTSATVSSSILAGTTTSSSANTPDNCAAVSSLTDGGYNVEDATSCGFSGTNGSLSGQSDAAIGLGSLADNGGPAQTEAIGTSSVAHYLVQASSGLCPATDERGDSRPQSSGFACDAGAYEAAPSQAISFTSSAPSAVVGGQTYTVTATGGSSGQAVTLSIDAAAATVCSIDNEDAVSFLAVGTCVIDANQAGGLAGGTNYLAAPQAQQSFTVSKGTQAISITSPAPNAVVGGPGYVITATGGGSTSPVTFGLDGGSSGCSLSGADVSFTGVGTCVIDANQAGDSNYLPALQAQQSFAVGQAAQAITFTSPAPSAVFGSPSYTVTATGGASGERVTLSLDDTSSGCSLTGAVVSFTGVGTCVIDANQSGSTEYAAAPQAQQSFAVGQATQAITFTSPAPSGAVFGGPTYTPAASGGASGNAVSFSVDANAASVCSINNGTVSFVGVGTCVIDAGQPGSTDYAAAPQAQQSFVVGQAPQAITFTSPAPSALVGGPTYVPGAGGGGSGNAVTFSVEPSSNSVCSITSGAVSFIGVGTCVIDANQSGSTDYAAAPQAQQSFVVGQGTQAITFTSPAPGNAIFGGPGYTPMATGGPSGNAVSFSVDASASSVCALAGDVVSFIGVGTCVIDASQPGSTDYAAAPQAQQSFVVGQAPQAITFTSPAPSAVFGSPAYAVTAVGGASGNGVTFTLDGTSLGCSLGGAAVRFTGVGTCVIDANQAGSTDYAAAPQAQQSFAVGQAAQAITFISPAPGNAVFGGPGYTPIATGGASGNTVSFSVDASASPVCALAGGVVSFTGVGTCVIDASQPGSTDYAAAPQAQQSFVVGQAPQAITFTSPTPSAVFGSPAYTVTASGGDSGNGVTFTLDGTSLGCSLSGSVVSFPSVGTCVIDATQAGSTDYAPAPQMQQRFSVAKANSQTDLSMSASSIPYGDEQALKFTVSVSPQFSGSPTGVVSILHANTTLCKITLSSSKTCSIAPSHATLLPPGTFAVTASYEGSTDFSASASSTETFTVSKAVSATSLTLSTGSVVYGAERTLKIGVTLSAKYGGIPTGAVSVLAGKTRLCTITLSTSSKGKGTCSPSARQIAIGTYLVTASFGGGTYFAPSVSRALPLKVT